MDAVGVNDQTFLKIKTSVLRGNLCPFPPPPPQRMAGIHHLVEEISCVNIYWSKFNITMSWCDLEDKVKATLTYQPFPLSTVYLFKFGQNQPIDFEERGKGRFFIVYRMAP